MRQSLPRQHASETEETEKVPVFVVKGIREAILDEVFQPGERYSGGRFGGEKRGENYWLYVPSLVQRRASKSIIGHAGPGRQSVSFVP